MELYSVYIAVLFFVFGTLAGSFLSVFVLRMISGEGFVAGRSKCPKCKSTIGARDLVPIFSYLSLGWRCRECKGKISPFYPILEIITGLVFALFYIRFGYLWINVAGLDLLNTLLFFAVYLLASMTLISVAAYDYKEMIIPDKIVFPSVLISVVLMAVAKLSGLDFFAYSLGLSEILWGLLIGGGFFLVLVLISKEKWMGWGDVKLGVLLGLLLGFPGIVISLLSSYIIGAIVGVLLIVLKIKKRKDPIQFAPFLVLGFFIALFWGRWILDWYLG